MGARRILPEELGDRFRVRQARAAGLSASRLRGSDLDAPFHGVRMRRVEAETASDPWDARRAEQRERARAYAPLLGAGRFFSHATAVALWGGPLAGPEDPTLDVTTIGDGPVARGNGVRGHRIRPAMATMRALDGLPVSSPATTWAMMGASLGVAELVVLGDYLVRVRRPGVGRPRAGDPPLATRDQLAAALAAGRRAGAARLREALGLIRLDAWSPRETLTRLALVGAGLPEPDLNIDVFDDTGMFVACVDLAYPAFHVGIEYQGRIHAGQHARDVERIERLREAGWAMLQVTSELARYPEVLARRTRKALASRGWRP